jgi:transcriptional regulator with XRE-family HTH domain
MSKLPPLEAFLQTDPKAIYLLRKHLNMTMAEFGVELATSGRRSEPYTRGHINNVEKGNLPVTEEMYRAAQALYYQIQDDELPPLIEGAIKHYPGMIHQGALYGGESKLCKWDNCNNHFIPRSGAQKQCPECKRRKRKK